jgi:protein involved in polysaccharide export with SLBB domain
MRKRSFIHFWHSCTGLNWLPVLLSLALFAPELHAQSACPDGSDADAIGCPSQLAKPPSLDQSPSTLSVQERPQAGTPSADNANEASANGSLANGASYSESATRKVRRDAEMRAVSPEPLSEFQNFVAATTGQTLPVYGARFFTTQPATFGPIDHGPAPGDLIVGPDDELRIRIWGQVNFSANLRVSREGEIYLPKVGAVHVAGMPFSAVPAHLRSVMERVYRNFELSVDLGEIHTIQIYVAGMAHQPGEYTVSALSTLVDALFATGGPSAAGSMRHLQLKRDGTIVTDFDLYALLIQGDKAGDVQLQPGDVLYIPPAGPQVALTGSVRQAAIFELRGEESIDQLLSTAGGRTAIANGARMSVDRIEDHARRRAFDVTTDAAGLATLLADGDIVHVDPIVSSYRDAVTLRGAVANPGRFLWHEGMRLSELMPERDALVKRDYWWKRTRLGLPAPPLAVAPSAGSQPNGAQSQMYLDNQAYPPTIVQSPGTHASVAQVVVPESAENQTMKPQAVQSPAAQTNWNQAVIERIDPSTMSTRLIPFPLGKLVLDHDMSQDLDLKPGDVVTVFAQQDIQLPIKEQTIYVELAGEFDHPGIYSVSAGETLHSVVARAGGMTDRAYLYGSSFTRISTQAVEQQQLNEYADRLEHQVERNSLGLVSGAGGSGQSTSIAGDQVASLNREMIARIRQVRASGRVVLNINPQSIDLKGLPDMRLEDGDRLVVPFVPETIQVIGAVFNPHAFLYNHGARVGEYLHLSGGPNRIADRKRMFVLRADGSVVGHDTGNSMFEDDFKKLRLYPGDAIVVPEKDVHPSNLNQIMIWSQLASQASLSALEVGTLK